MSGVSYQTPEGKSKRTVYLNLQNYANNSTIQANGGSKSLSTTPLDKSIKSTQVYHSVKTRSAVDEQANSNGKHSREPSYELPSASFASNGPSNSNENVKIYVRVRPIHNSENYSGRCLDIHGKNWIKVVTLSNTYKRFSFDSIFDESYSDQLFFEKSCLPTLSDFLAVKNGTILAFGQTGTGLNIVI